MKICELPTWFLIAGAITIGVVLIILTISVIVSRLQIRKLKYDLAATRAQEIATKQSLTRYIDLARNKELSNAEALEKLHAGVRDWRPYDPSGTPGSGDS